MEGEEEEKVELAEEERRRRREGEEEDKEEQIEDEAEDKNSKGIKARGAYVVGEELDQRKHFQQSHESAPVFK